MHEKEGYFFIGLFGFLFVKDDQHDEGGSHRLLILFPPLLCFLLPVLEFSFVTPNTVFPP